MKVAKSAKVQFGDWEAENKLKYSVFPRQNRNQSVALFVLYKEGDMEPVVTEFKGFETLYLP